MLNYTAYSAYSYIAVLYLLSFFLNVLKYKRCDSFISPPHIDTRDKVGTLSRSKGKKAQLFSNIDENQNLSLSLHSNVWITHTSSEQQVPVTLFVSNVSVRFVCMKPWTRSHSESYANNIHSLSSHVKREKTSWKTIDDVGTLDCVVFFRFHLSCTITSLFTHRRDFTAMTKSVDAEGNEKLSRGVRS